MAGPFDLTSQNIENTYQRILQTPDGVNVYDGTGSAFTITAVIDTGSLVTTSSFNAFTSSINTFTASYNTGSFSGSFTGSFNGTASWAESASQALTASYVNPLHQNVVITGSLLVTQSHISTVDYIDFTTGSDQPTSIGRLGWNDSDGTLSLGLKGGNLNLLVGEAEVAYVYNAENTPLTKGEVVYITGSQGNRISVKRAFATADASSAGTLGFVAETIINGQTGFVVVRGVLRKIDTSAYAEGALIYLSSSAGQYTTVKPQAPIHEVRLGYIERVGNNNQGSIYVKVDNGYEIDELHDVRIISASSGDLLIRSSSLWINSKTLSGSYILSGSLTTNDGIWFQNLTASFVSASSGITGSLFGTASWANSASQALTSSYINTLNQNLTISGNIIPAGPYINNISSYNLGSPTAAWDKIYVSNNSLHFVSGSVSSSIGFNNGIISFNNATVNIPTGSTVLTSSYADTASFVQTAQTASYVLNAQSASNAIIAQTASTADNFTVRGNLIISGNATIGDVTTDIITLNATTMSLGSGNGILNIDSNTLYVDGANNRVGILTTSPSSSLHVNGSTLLGGTVAAFSDFTSIPTQVSGNLGIRGGFYVYAPGSGTTSSMFWGSAGALAWTTRNEGNTVYRFLSGSTVLYHMSSSGLGILKSTNNAALDVNGNAIISGSLTITGNTTINGLTASQIVATDANDTLVSLSTSTYPSLTELSYLKGVTSAIQTQFTNKLDTFVLRFSSNQVSPADNTTYYFNDSTVPLSTSATIYKLIFPFACTLVGASISAQNNQGTATAEASTISFRLNNLADTQLSNSVVFNGTPLVVNAYSVTGLNTSIAAGDTGNIKWVTPTWVTNPTQAVIVVNLYLQRT